MSERSQQILGDLITHKKGFAFKSNDLSYLDGVNVVKLTNIVGNRIDLTNCQKVSKIVAENLTDYLLLSGDVIVATVGSWPSNPASVVGKVILVDEKSSNALLNQNAVRLRVCGDLCQRYLYYLLSNADFQTYIINTAQGSANQASITLNDIFSYRFYIPPLSEQEAIAEVLSSLDDKIDLLRRNNKTLEQLAETLFRQWFVEGAEDGWHKTSLYDAMELVGGGTPKTSISQYWNGDISWLSGGDIASNHKSIVSTSEKSITELGLQNSSAKVLPKFSTVISARGTVGKYCLLGTSMAFSQSNYGIKPKFKDCYFFTYLLVNNYVDELLSTAYGSVFDTITSETFKNLKVLLPDEKYINDFDRKVGSLFHKMLNNITQIETLIDIRDTLLPKLMSGAVRVNDMTAS